MIRIHEIMNFSREFWTAARAQLAPWCNYQVYFVYILLGGQYLFNNSNFHLISKPNSQLMTFNLNIYYIFRANKIKYLSEIIQLYQCDSVRRKFPPLNQSLAINQTRQDLTFILFVDCRHNLSIDKNLTNFILMNHEQVLFLIFTRVNEQINQYIVQTFERCLMVRHKYSIGPMTT